MLWRCHSFSEPHAICSHLMKDLSHCLWLLLYWTWLLQASCSALQTGKILLKQLKLSLCVWARASFGTYSGYRSCTRWEWWESAKHFTWLHRRCWSSATGPNTIDRELDEYLTAVRQGVLALDSAFTFWQAKTSEWPILAPFALDVVPLPPSQASTERVFSVCGDFAKGKRNRTLERAVFLRTNGKKFVMWIMWCDWQLTFQIFEFDVYF